MVQNKSLTAIGIPGNFRSKLGFSSNLLALSIAAEKSSVTYAFNSLDFSDLSTNAFVTSVEESFLSLIFLINSESDCFVISDIIQSPLVLQNNLHFLGVNFLLFVLLNFYFLLHLILV